MNKKGNNIGLFFGSFNPVHVGHLALANFMVENSSLDEIWFVVSPQNPFKKREDLLSAQHRINILTNSVSRYSKFKVSDVELSLPTPSYTYSTLREYRKIHPENNFSIIMGSDNLIHLKRWKNIDEILDNHKVVVYPRPGYEIQQKDVGQNIEVITAPVFNIDSTIIREGLKNGKNYSFLIPEEAHIYIEEKGLYK